jgi:hypothetical protein
MTIEQVSLLYASHNQKFPICFHCFCTLLRLNRLLVALALRISFPRKKRSSGAGCAKFQHLPASVAITSAAAILVVANFA